MGPCGVRTSPILSRRRSTAAVAVDGRSQRHIEHCLRCQAELARYRKMLRGLQLLRTRYLEPAPGLLAQTLAAIEEAGERQVVRSILSGRRLAYAGAIGGAAVAAGTAAAVMIARTVPGGAPSRHELTAQCRRGPGSVPTNAGDASGAPDTPLLSFVSGPTAPGGQ